MQQIFRPHPQGVISDQDATEFAEGNRSYSDFLPTIGQVVRLHVGTPHRIKESPMNCILLMAT